ncbi:GTPase IMAP family member 4-like [Salarias fasciatus]|uniref:GTPase IMAP family member 4-like n=1 Tax=Salarias fasciatus TaxID=181472 RepID=UPI001176C45D|nr:GTPase IMAP family member 4-like [Salarias fasciatus]
MKAFSSAGNTILGKDAFSVSHRRTTDICEIYNSMVAGRQLTVVDSSGWLYNHTLQDSTETDKLEIKSSMHLCPQGPQAVLLVIGLAAAFNASYLRAVLDHMDLFGHKVWKHTIVLFTRGDWLGVKTVEERIASEGGLEWLVNKCGNRYHVLNNMDRSDEMQVKEFLEKIEEMWAGNEDPQYELDNATKTEAGKEAVEATAKRMRQIAQRQSRVLREMFEGERQPVTDLRIVLIGRKESGKSNAGNMILCQEIFDAMLGKKEFQKERSKATCVKHQRNIMGVNVSVVETPGWIANTTPPSWIKQEVLSSISMCAPGPDVFLLVVPICKAYTEKDHDAVVELLTPFGERVWRHCMVLFTWGDWLNRRTIEDHITGEGKFLQRLVEQCGNRYHVLSCGRSSYPGAVSELLSIIHDMITVNKGQCFTTEKKQLFKKFRKVKLTEEEWNRREQQLIDRMLRALANEPEQLILPTANAAGSFDGGFLPNCEFDINH